MIFKELLIIKVFRLSETKITNKFHVRMLTNINSPFVKPPWTLCKQYLVPHMRKTLNNNRIL